MKTIRQGDVLLVPIPDDDPVNRYHGRPEYRDRKLGIVLAAGEVTGHHHRVKHPRAHVRSVRRANGVRRRILFVSKYGAVIEHEEHSTLTVPPGRYEVVGQTEYTPPAGKQSGVLTEFAARTRVYD